MVLCALHETNYNLKAVCVAIDIKCVGFNFFIRFYSIDK